MAGVTFNSNIYGGFALMETKGNRVVARTGFIPSGYAANIGLGDPIQVDATTGAILAVTGDPDGASITGVFLGCEYEPADQFNVRHFFKGWVSGTATKGAKQVKARYVPAKGNLFIVKAASGQTITEALRGDLLAATQGTPDTYGNSTLVIDATSTPANAAAATVRVVDFVKDAAGNRIAFIVELVNAI